MPSAPIALITGAAQRIGRALALDLAAHGWGIGLHCHDSVDEAESLAAEIRAKGAKVAVLKADLADIAAVADLVPRCAAALGPPTCLINNASMFTYDDVATLDPGVWDAQLAVNLKAPGIPGQGLRGSPARRRGRQRDQYRRPARMEAHAAVLLLRRLQVRLVECHAHAGTGLGAPRPRQRHRARPGPEERPSVRRGISPAVRGHHSASVARRLTRSPEPSVSSLTPPR